MEMITLNYEEAFVIFELLRELKYIGEYKCDPYTYKNMYEKLFKRIKHYMKEIPLLYVLQPTKN